jgi:hypothetical protein
MDSVFEYSNSLSKETIWHGNHNDNDGNIILKAGQLSMLYENGNLRYVSSGNREIIRMIYSSVRITGWVTIKPVISEEEFDIHPDSFSIKFLCRYVTKEINFSARYTISGNTDNSLIISMKGEALNTFEKNRIGFCVLHPIVGYAGESCSITHNNDEIEKLEFPGFITPHQPFSDIKSMTWHISDIKCTLNFSGDTFETEDQRNWSDASYKTYCTPLSLPFPVKLEKGERINQKIELLVEGCSSDKSGLNRQIEFHISPDKTTNIPMVGIGRSTRPDPVTKGEIQILKKLRFDHYRVDVYLFDPDWQTIAERAANEAEKLEYPVEFSLFFDENAVNQVNDFINWLNTWHSDIALIHLFHKDIQSTPDILTETVAPILNNTFPGVKISCGTNANFVHLNRNWPESVHADYISYSIHPQEHAPDNTTLIENIQAQQYTVDSATRFANGKGIWISPVNIQRRFNGNIENYESPATGNEIPPQVDNRLMSIFGACWTAGSLKYLLESGIKGVTYFETVGERGIFQGEFPSHWPEDFKACEGMIFPVFHLFRYLFNNKLFKVVESKSSHPLKAEILVLTDGQNFRMIAVNYTSEQIDVIFKGIKGSYKIKTLNAYSYASAASDFNWVERAPSLPVNLKEKIPLEPFSVSFIES